MLPIVISCFSLIVAAASLWYARKAYLLNFQKERRQNSLFSIYISETAHFLQGTRETIQLSCIINNLSDIQNSIILAEIIAEFIGNRNATFHVRYPLTSATGSDSGKGIAREPFPIHFGPRESKSLNLQANLNEDNRPLDSRHSQTNVLLTSGDGSSFGQVIELHREEPIF